MPSNISVAAAVEVAGLAKTYRLYHNGAERLAAALFPSRAGGKAFPALMPVSFAVRPGEVVGIVGRNGSGKSTLLQLICGTLQPTSGSVRTRGRLAAMLELGAGFHPDFSGEENVFLNAAILGLSREETRAKFEEIVAFSGIGPFIGQPVATYSSGMYLRLAFAVAFAARPDVLVIDEALAVGDEAFQAKCFSRLKEMQRQGSAILFVSHSAAAVTSLCTRALLMDGGELLMDGTPKAVVTQYHRLIFASPAHQPGLREEVRRAAAAPSAPAVSLQDLLDSGLSNESRVEYPPRGARIMNPRIENDLGEPVNLLRRREQYRYRFEVAFDHDCKEVRCGMMIRTGGGVELGGSGTSALGETIAAVAAGQRLSVIFRFTCALLPGTYYINAGCSGVEGGERVFLHRITDACVFKVQPEGDIAPGGIVDFYVEPSLEIAS